MIVFILGGARSGKSSLAEKIAAGQEEKYGRQIIYLATATAKDREMETRIKKHQAERPDNWITIEADLNPDQSIKAANIPDESVIILDCLTLLLSNHLLEKKDFDLQELKDKLNKLIKYLSKKECLIIFVSNETGLGIVPGNKLSREFRDQAGWLNQWIAAKADKTFFTVAGIPVELDKNKFNNQIIKPENFFPGGKKG